MRFIFQAATFVNAFLLFLMQPLVSKMLLPTFGGSPLVWNTAMLFFQALLLGGYAYAHWVAKKPGEVSRKRLAFVGALLLLAAVLPLHTPAWALSAYQNQLNLNPTGIAAHPVVALLGCLFATAAIPFLAISGTAPLLQYLYRHTGAADAESPYFLYRASNWGAVFALVLYPVIIEPSLGLSDTARGWKAGFLMLLALLASCAWLANKPASAEAETVVQDKAQRAKWVLLAAGPSCLLLGCTYFLTSNIAPIPLLWVLPLLLYLLSYILAFSDKFKPRNLNVQATLGAVTIPLASGMTVLAHNKLLPLVIGANLLGLFCLCYACHYALAQSRPPASQLTQFYFSLSLGGVIGSFCAAILAPLALRTVGEYPLAAAACAVAFGLSAGVKLEPRDWLTGLAALGACWYFKHVHAADQESMVFLVPTVVLVFLSALRPTANSFVIAGTFIAVWLSQSDTGFKDLLRERDFYGTRTVRDDSGIHWLINGNTLHGYQELLRPFRPAEYYEHNSGIGTIMEATTSTLASQHMAVVGLGVGAMAAYGWKGQTLDFYEIDPEVERIARNPALFTFLRDSQADVRVVIGDARLKLEQAPDHSYNIIALDAFSSDAIPTHLLTREALELYQRKLAPHGILTIHVSNRHLDLGPVIAASAQPLGCSTYRYRTLKSDWILVAPADVDLAKIFAVNIPERRAKDRWTPILPKASVPGWTDDFSNVLSVVSWTGIYRL